MRASPTSQGEPQIVMAREAKGLTCEDMVTFAWEKSWIWCRPIPAWPMTWPVMASGMARVPVMHGSFMEGVMLHHGRFCGSRVMRVPTLTSDRDTMQLSHRHA